MGKNFYRWIIVFCLVLAIILVALQYNNSFAVVKANDYKHVEETLFEEAEMDYSLETVVISSKEAIEQQMDIRKGGKQNTTYVISSEINLEGEFIELPEACVLKFEGGSISNGCIVGNNTVIEALPRQIFSSTLSLKGTWCIETAYVEWYGCKAQKKYNKNVAIKNTEAIQNTINAFKNVTFGVSSNNDSFYYVSAMPGNRYVIGVHDPVTISGKNQVSTQIVYVGDEDIPVFYFTKDNAEYVFGPRYSTIQNLCIRGLNDKSRKGSAIFVEYGVAHTCFNNLYFSYLNECFVCDSWSATLNNCKAEVSNVGFRLGVKNNGLPNLNLTKCGAGVCKIAFALSGVFYSTYMNCSSDYCGKVWDIKDCNGLSLITIGAEHNRQFMNIEGSESRNIKISNAFVCVYKEDKMTEDDWNNYVFIGKKVKNVVFDQVDFEMNEPQILASIKNRDLHFININGTNGSKQSFSIGNSYCSRGDINEFIN